MSVFLIETLVICEVYSSGLGFATLEFGEVNWKQLQSSGAGFSQNF
jgi:hypothetical protein